MKKTLITLLCCTLFITATHAQVKKYENKAGHFSVGFPGEVTPQTEDVPSEAGNLKMNMFMCTPDEGKDANGLYAVDYTDYPSDLISSDSNKALRERFFTGAVNGFAKNVSGEIVNSSSMMYKIYPGVKAKVSMEGGFMYVQAYLVKSRLYLLMVGCDTDKDGNAGIEKFFKSFELLK